nr:MarR family transcriptional regulator [Actinomycetota bacterium]
MGHRSDTRFLVLHGLRLKGFGEPPAIAAAVGLDDSAVTEHLAKLAADDLVLHRDGRLTGWTLTAAGRAEQQRLAAADLEASGALADIRAVYKRFLAMNQDFKVLCTDWQVRDGELYDHADDAYNTTIVERLRAMHTDVVEVLGELAGAVGRYAEY